MTGREAGLGTLLVASAGGSIAVTMVTGAPARLPDVALDSVVLFHTERTLALFLLTVLAIAVVARGFQGRLPDKLGRDGLEYVVQEKAVESSEVIAADVARALDQLRTELEEELRQSGRSITEATLAALLRLEERVSDLEDRMTL
jgi:hypothetical protein